MIKFKFQSRWLLLAILGAFSQPHSALASGFALVEQSVPGLGNAYAGGAATAEDASTIFFNPAGLTRLEGKNAANAVYGIFPAARFKNEGSTIVTGAPLLGNSGGDGGVNVLVSNSYSAMSLSDRLKIGLGVNAPFGLGVHYNNGWIGRYQGIESRLSTINISPVVAYKLTNTVSVGAGIDFQYAAAVLSNAIDFGLIGRSAGLRTLPQSADGFVKIAGDDWSVGYNIGLMYEPTPTTRIGLAYRSKISHKLKGDADFTVPTAAALLTSRGRFTDTDATAELKLPDSLSLAAYHQISPRVALMGDITWTNWSRFKELRIDYDNPAQPPTIQPENWRDTFRVGLGMTYKASDALTLRAGVAYDKSPVEDEFRTVRIPDNNRFWLAAGIGYRLSKSLSVDVGYAHLFVGETSINQGSATEGFVRGEFNNHVDIVGVQLTLNF